METFLSCPFTFWLYKYNKSFWWALSWWSVQFGHFLVFFVLLLSVLPCSVICKSEGTCPRPLLSRRHFRGTVYTKNSHSIWMHGVTRTIFPVLAFKVMHRVILLTWFCKLLNRVAILSGEHVPQVPQWHDASECLRSPHHLTDRQGSWNAFLGVLYIYSILFVYIHSKLSKNIVMSFFKILWWVF